MDSNITNRNIKEKTWNPNIIEQNSHPHGVNLFSESTRLVGRPTPSIKSEAIGRILTALGTELILEHSKCFCPVPIVKVPILSLAGFQACTKKPRMALPDPALIVPAREEKGANINNVLFTLKNS